MANVYIDFPGQSFPITFPSPFGKPPFVATAALLVPAIEVADVVIDAPVLTATTEILVSSVNGAAYIAATLFEATAEIPIPIASCPTEVIIPWKGTDFPGTFPIPLVTTNASFWHIQDPSLLIEIFVPAEPMEAVMAGPSPAIMLAVGILAKINNVPVANIAKYKDLAPAGVSKINDVAWLN